MHFKFGKYIIYLFTKRKIEKNFIEEIGQLGKDSKIVNPFIHSEIDKLFIGDNTTILPYSRIQSYSNHGVLANKILIKNNYYIGYYFSCLNASTIEIGNNVLIASNVLITSIKHGINPELNVPYMDQDIESSPVIIGDNCWIGEKVIILPGVTIGEGCVIGGGTVVTHDIPSFSIVVGNPGKVIKQYNFSSHCWEAL